jgi:putative intracellular protease/amidase
MSKGTIVIVATQHTELLGGHGKTGAWAEEVAEPYYVFKEAGYSVTLATPSGGKITWDDVSLAGDAKTAGVTKFLNDDEASKAVSNTVALSKISPDDFAAVFLAGGHGAAFDFPGNKVLADLLTNAYKKGKVVSAVCHGPAGLVDALNPEGKPLVSGLKVTGFSNSEEVAVGKTDAVPTTPEDQLKGLGGLYSKGADWSSYVQSDKKLVTGQNPASSAATAKAVVDALA